MTMIFDFEPWQLDIDIDLRLAVKARGSEV